jgi:hypothetical protein
MVGQTRVGGSGDYFLGKDDTRFTFNCVFDEKNKTITSAVYTVYQVGSERLVPPENQAQDCQEKTFAKVTVKKVFIIPESTTVSEGSSQRIFITPKSIRSKTKKNGDRTIYGDGVLPTGPFGFSCTYRDDRLVKLDLTLKSGTSPRREIASPYRWRCTTARITSAVAVVREGRRSLLS